MNDAKEMKKNYKTIDLVYIALGAVLITICSWISIPTTVPFTMQTFAVFFILSILGGKRGTVAIIVSSACLSLLYLHSIRGTRTPDSCT